MEGSLQLFSLPAYASGAQSVEIENIAFAGNALVAAMTYPLVLYNWAGALSLRNIYIYDAAHAGAVTTIEVNPGGGTAPLTVIADNISVTNSQTLAQTFVSTFGGPQAFLVRGFTVKNAAENVIDYIPEQLYNNLTAGTTSKGAIFTTVTGNDGTAILPTYVTASEASLGWYRSAASTMALSYGTLWPQGTLWVTSGISAKSSVASFSYTSSSRTAMATEVWSSGFSALGSIVTTSYVSSARTVIGVGIWGSGLSIGNATAGGSLIPAISSTSSRVAAFVVQGSSSSFTLVLWTGVQPGDIIITTPYGGTARSSMSSGLVAHSHCTQVNQFEFRLSNCSTLVQNQSSQSWAFVRISPF